MSAIPDTFRAYVAEKVDRDGAPAVDRGVRPFAASDLPHAHRVFDAIRLFRGRTDVPEQTKAKILANGARFFA